MQAAAGRGDCDIGAAARRGRETANEIERQEGNVDRRGYGVLRLRAMLPRPKHSAENARQRAGKSADSVGGDRHAGVGEAVTPFACANHDLLHLSRQPFEDAGDHRPPGEDEKALVDASQPSRLPARQDNAHDCGGHLRSRFRVAGRLCLAGGHSAPHGSRPGSDGSLATRYVGDRREAQAPTRLEGMNEPAGLGSVLINLLAGRV